MSLSLLMGPSNPFPDETAVRRMVRFYDLLATPQERDLGRFHGLSTDVTVRASLLGQVLTAARQFQGWTEREVAEWLGVRRDLVMICELGVLDEPGVVRRYVELLGVQTLFRQWVERNEQVALELGLVFSAPPTRPLFPELATPRLPQHPRPRPFVISQKFFEIPTEAELARLAADAEARDRQGRLVF